MLKTINVTQHDIDKGCRRAANNCPITLAVTRLLKKNYKTRVGGAHVLVYYIDKLTTYACQPAYNSLSSIARVFVHQFDDGRPVAPFKFKVNIPDEALRGRK